ncbi:MAG: AmmeMemoRadiSam system protein B [Candidatus Riflebacteria bacterium]|nr:AmmeMemoRadiSam system protein B [Candidatus Riflebacteria bacterium]
MATRRAIVAGQFYRGDAAGCAGQLTECLSGFELPEGVRGPFLGGIVPHAGWMFSGPTAGKVFQAIQTGGTPRTFVLLGADHGGAADRPTLYPSGSWQTPLGPVDVDEGLGQHLAK